MSNARHLVHRFFGSLRPGGPPERDLTWVESTLSLQEIALWKRMSGPDRRHSAQVARDVRARLAERATAPVLAAALLHDVGKIDSRHRTYGRVVATLTTKIVGRDEVLGWRRSRGLHRRIALYVDHPTIGGDLLQLANSDPLTVAWAREHHNPRDTWTVDPDIANVLDACDND